MGLVLLEDGTTKEMRFEKRVARLVDGTDDVITNYVIGNVVALEDEGAKDTKIREMSSRESYRSYLCGKVYPSLNSVREMDEGPHLGGPSCKQS